MSLLAAHQCFVLAGAGSMNIVPKSYATALKCLGTTGRLLLSDRALSTAVIHNLHWKPIGVTGSSRGVAGNALKAMTASAEAR